jgi:hypothetical protein
MVKQKYEINRWPKTNFGLKLNKLLFVGKIIFIISILDFKIKSKWDSQSNLHNKKKIDTQFTIEKLQLMKTEEKVIMQIMSNKIPSFTKKRIFSFYSKLLQILSFLKLVLCGSIDLIKCLNTELSILWWIHLKVLKKCKNLYSFLTFGLNFTF